MPGTPPQAIELNSDMITLLFFEMAKLMPALCQVPKSTTVGLSIQTSNHGHVEGYFTIRMSGIVGRGSVEAVAIVVRVVLKTDTSIKKGCPHGLEALETYAMCFRESTIYPSFIIVLRS